MIKIKLIIVNLVIPLNLVKLTADEKLTGCIIHNDSGHYGILLNNLKKIILKNEFIDRKFLNFVLILKSKFQEQKKGNSSKVLSTVCQPF